MAKMKLRTREHGTFILDDVESIEIDGLRFFDANAIAKLFDHPARIVRLFRQGEAHDMPCFEILKSPEVQIDDLMAMSVKTLYGISDAESPEAQ